jgi:hypothetical protein
MSAKKDVIFSMRINRRVRDALKEAAEQECRTVSSLLNKIIQDYLEREGFSKNSHSLKEQRKFPRKVVTLPAKATVKTKSGVRSFPSVIRNISTGGILISCYKGPNKLFTSTGECPHFQLSFQLPRTDEEICFECEPCHMRDDGKEIQIGAAFARPDKQSLQKLSSYVL